MKLSKSIEGFLLSKLADGYSPGTLRGYQSSLGLLTEYLDDTDVEAITPDNLKAFMHYIRTDYKPERRSGNIDPLSTASHHRYWKALRSFFKWAAEDLKTGRPDIDLKMPQFTNREIVPFSHEEIGKLLKGCERSSSVSDGTRKPYQCKRPTAVRDRALVLVLLDTGIRAGECTRLRIRDTNLTNGEVYIQPYHVRKTRPRTTYIGKSARKAVWKYLTTREEPRQDDPLFVSPDGRQMTQQSILKMIHAIGRTSGVRNAHPHRFRHTFAIQFLRNGGDVFTLQRLLGHSTLDMVRHYLALADADSAEAHRRSSPVDRWSF